MFMIQNAPYAPYVEIDNELKSKQNFITFRSRVIIKYARITPGIIS